MSVYKKAAKDIANGELSFACPAIHCILRKNRSELTFVGERPEELAFAEVFHPGPNHVTNRYGWFGDIDNEENRMARSLALLFMHEMEKK